MKLHLFPIAATLASMMAVACDSDAMGPDDPKPVICPTSIDMAIIEKQNDFAFSYLKLAPADDNGNSVVSPLSLSMALSIAANGASGETLDEILDALGFDNSSLSDVNSLNSMLMEVLPQMDSKTRLSLANTLWIHKDFPVNESFKDLCNNTYKAEANSIDMYSDEAVGIINRWAEKHTAGLIKNFISEAPCARLAIMNALYFKGKWADKFPKSETMRRKFHNADGSTPEVEMMHDSRHTCAAWEDDGVTIVSLPYGNGSFRMTLLLPDEGITTEQCAAALTDAKWNDWQTHLSQEGTISLTIPKFDIESENQPIEMLQSLGMRRAFTGNAEFPGISPQPLAISKIRQRTHVIVDEEGTEAAAVTDIEFDLTAPSPGGIRTLVIDRPFIFVISESDTSSILFMGKINNL